MGEMSSVSQQTFETWLVTLPSETYTSADLQLPAHMRKNLRQMFDADHHADVTLLCDTGESMTCHRGVLGMNSPVIQTMLSSDFEEAKNKEIKFSDISFAHLKKVVRFLYGFDLEITAHDLVPLLQFADMYDIGPLRELCGKMLMKHVNADVAMEVWLLAHRYNAPEFYASAQEYSVRVYNDNLDQYPVGFYQADKKMIIDLLSDAELHIASENDVLDAIIDWVMHEQDGRATEARTILEKCIRVQTLSLHYIHVELQRIGWSKFNDTLKAAIWEYSADSIELKHNLLPPRVNTREVVALSCCVFAGSKLVVASYKMHHGLVSTDNNSEVFTRKLNIHASFIVDNRVLVVTKGSDPKLHHMGMLWTRNNREHYAHALYCNKIACGSVLFVRLPDGPVTVFSKIGDTQVDFFKLPCIDMWKDDQCWHFDDEVLSPDKGPLIVSSISNYVVMFSPENNEACVMDLEEDVHWSHISVDFKGDATCSAVATYCNVACVISQRFLYVIRLRNLVFERKESVPTRVRAPTVAQGKKLTSAVIYGQHLYIAETPATNRKLVLHATNFNDLLPC